MGQQQKYKNIRYIIFNSLIFAKINILNGNICIGQKSIVQNKNHPNICIF